MANGSRGRRSGSGSLARAASAALIEATDGNLYGTAWMGGIYAMATFAGDITTRVQGSSAPNVFVVVTAPAPAGAPPPSPTSGGCGSAGGSGPIALGLLAALVAHRKRAAPARPS